MRKNLSNKNKGFTTPENYFSNLNRDIMAATCNKTESKKRSPITLPKFAGIMGYAAMIAIVAVFAIRFVVSNTRNTTDITAFEQLDDSEYIDNMLTNYPIDEYTFYCYLTGE